MTDIPRKVKVCPHCWSQWTNASNQCLNCGKTIGTGKSLELDQLEFMKIGKKACPHCQYMIQKPAKTCPVCKKDL